MKFLTYLLFFLFGASAMWWGLYFAPSWQPWPPTQQVQGASLAYPVSSKTAPRSGCDPTLWQHVYSGDPRRFKKPQDRLKVIEECKTVRGVIISAKVEKDGDFHIQLDVQDKSLLNAKNMSGQKGYLVLEPVCENPVSQRDTLQDGACSGYTGHIFNKSMIGRMVDVTGAYVEDEEHGWREEHPVSAITVLAP